MLTLLRQQTSQSSAQTSTAIRRQHLQSYLMVWDGYAVHQSHRTSPGGSIVLECVAGLPWNTQSNCHGLPNRLPPLYSIN
jgi:hypothetical protein